MINKDDPLLTALESIKPKPKQRHSVFARVQNKFGEREYLSADTEEEIEAHCEGGVLGDELCIEEWCHNVTPIMVSKHFKWVGARRNPFVIAKPIYEYKDGIFVGLRNFKEKF